MVSLVPVYQTEERQRDFSTISQDACFLLAFLYCRHSKNSKSDF